MKIKMAITIFLLSYATIWAQFGPQQIISNIGDGPFRAIPIDLDMDGQIDVVSAHNYSGASKVVWFKNLDGQGNFDSEQIINNTIIAMDGMELADLDSDGDMDILYKTNLDIIAWLENLDGLGSFGPEQIIADTNYPYTMSLADVDGDGDMDIFANLYYDTFYGQIVWYENLDGLGTFSSEKLIEIGDFYISILLNFDLDNDGDMDLITSYESYNPSKLIWYENLDGLGNFSDSQEIYQFDLFASDWTSIYNLAHADVNGDGKIDLLVATSHDTSPDRLLWLENLDAQGSFDSPIHIHNNETSLGSLRSYDLDSDGDNDLLVSFFYHNAYTSISWFENLDGQGSFSDKKIISTDVVRARDATSADINDDGFLDVISASGGTDSKVAWYENLMTLGILENPENLFSLSPNPTKGIIQIYSEVEILGIEVYNVLGTKLQSLKNKTQIDLSHTTTGIYFVKLMGEDGVSEIHKIIKE